MPLKLPGVHAREARLAAGTVKVYYRHRTTGLNLGSSDDEAAVLARYNALQAIREPVTVRSPGSFAAALSDYKASPEWADKAPTTKETWGRAFRRLENLWGPYPLATITQSIAAAAKAAFIKAHGPDGAKTQLAVASAVWGWLKQSGRTELPNPFLMLGKFKTRDQRKEKREKKRKAIWRREHVRAVLDARRLINAGGNPALTKGKTHYKEERTPPDIRMALLLGLYTLQRQTDVLDVKAEHIVRRHHQLWWRFDQSKTDEFLGIPLHPTLADEIERQQIEPGEPRLIVRGPISGKRFIRRNFGRRFRLWTKAAGVSLTFQALRRSGMVALAEAGVPIAHIAALSGHSINYTQQIIDEYIPRTEEMAGSAIAAWVKADAALARSAAPRALPKRGFRTRKSAA